MTLQGLDALRAAWMAAEDVYRQSFVVAVEHQTRPGDFRDVADAARDAYGAALTAERDAALADAREMWAQLGTHIETNSLRCESCADLLRDFAVKYGVRQ